MGTWMFQSWVSTIVQDNRLSPTHYPTHDLHWIDYSSPGVPILRPVGPWALLFRLRLVWGSLQVVWRRRWRFGASGCEGGHGRALLVSPRPYGAYQSLHSCFGDVGDVLRQKDLPPVELLSCYPVVKASVLFVFSKRTICHLKVKFERGYLYVRWAYDLNET